MLLFLNVISKSYLISKEYEELRDYLAYIRSLLDSNLILSYNIENNIL
jgi:hypothetical protein